MATMEELMLGGNTKPASSAPKGDVASLMLGDEAPAKTGPEGGSAKSFGREFAASTVQNVKSAGANFFRMFAADRMDREQMSIQMFEELSKDPRVPQKVLDGFAHGATEAAGEARRAMMRADTVDQYWDEKIQPMMTADPTFSDKVARGFGSLPMAPAAAVPAIGIPIIYSRMYGEGYHSYWENNPDGTEEAAMKQASIYADIATPAEFVMDKLIIAKGGVKGLKGLKGKALTETLGANGLRLLRKMGLSGTGEEITETFQQGIDNKLNGKSFFDGYAENAGVSFTVGMFGGAPSSLASSFQQANVSNELREGGMPEAAIGEVINDLESGRIDMAQTLIGQYGVELDAEVLGEQLRSEDLDYGVLEYKVGAKRLGNAAVSRTTGELEKELDEMSTDFLMSVASDLGYQGDGSVEDVKKFIVQNKTRIPKFQRQAEANLLKTIDESGLTPFQKQAYKWMAQGDVDLTDVGMVRAIFGEEAKKAGYADVDAYFEDNQGTFTAPTAGEIDLFQQAMVESLKVEDNPRFKRGKKFAAANVLQQNREDDFETGSGYFNATGALQALEYPRMFRHYLDTTRDEGRLTPKDIEAIRQSLAQIQEPTESEQKAIKIINDLLAAEDRAQYLEENRDAIWDIADDMTDEWEAEARELDEYNPFTPGSAAHSLFSGAMNRKSMRVLSFDPSLSIWESEWRGGGGIVGGRNQRGGRILEAATHEAAHGNGSWSHWLYEAESADAAWYKEVRDIARMLYWAPGDNMKLVEEYLDRHEQNAADELMAMYMAGVYNNSSAQKGVADQMVENMFQKAFGDEFVEAMRMSREAGQAKSVPENLQGQRYGEFYQADSVRVPPAKAVASGHTIPVYHQTRAKFNIFDKDRAMGASNARSGPGFYFSDDAGDTAGSYGGNVMPMWLKLKNPLRISENDRTSVYSGMTEEQIKRATQATVSAREETVLEQLLDGTIESWAGGSQYHIKTKTRGSATGFFSAEVFEELGIEDGVKLSRAQAERVADFIESGKIDSDFSVSKTERKRGWVAQQIETQKILKEMGYDGVAHEQDDGRMHYVVFDSAQAKHEDATTFDPSDPNIFHQTGATTPSGATTIRGKTQFQADGKFVVDLFKGGDVVTLAHEFAHVFSPHATPEMIDQMIGRITSVNRPGVFGKSKASLKAQRQYMKNVWKTFAEQGADHPRFANKQGKDWQYLVAMQEELAQQFETYLATRTAPSQELVPAFKRLADRYKEYYGKIRDLPPDKQNVHHDIATAFDQMLAGERALPRVQPRVIEVDGDRMTLHLSRPKEKMRRETLKALERVNVWSSGLKAKVQEYLDEVFTTTTKDNDGNPVSKTVIPDGFKLALELVKNNKDALALLKKVDAELARRDLAAKRSIIKDIKAKTKDTVLNDMDKGIADMIRDTIAGFDTGRKTKKRIRDVFALRKAIKDRLLNNTQLTADDLLSSREDLEKLISIKKPSIYSLTTAQVQTLSDAIDDLIRYDDVRAKQHIDREIKMQNERHESFSSANKKTWQWNTRLKDRPVIMEKIGSVFRKFVASSLESPSRTLEGLHEQGKRLYQELTAGRVKQQATRHQFEDDMGAIFSDVSLQGVSASLGPVDKDSMVTIKMSDKNGREVDMDFTLGQLMYMYGTSFNEDGLRHLMLGGIRIPKGSGKKKGDEANLYKFRSPQEMFTAFGQIPPELRQKVHQVMSYYTETVAPLINETSRDLLGVDLANIENYMPLAVEGQARGDKRVLHLTQMGQKGRAFALEQVEHAKFLQSRKGGSAPLYAVDMFDMVSNNLRDVAMYTSMGRPLRSATALLQPGGVGSIHNQLSDMLGQKRADHLWEWIQDLEDPTRKQSGFDRAINKMSGVVRRGILKLNISVSLSQIVSLNNIKNYLGSGGRLDLASSIIGANGRPLLAKYTREQMAEMHPTLRERFTGVPEVGLESANENIKTQQMFGKHGGMGRQVAGHALLMGDTGLGPIKRMDGWAISKIIETMEKQAKRNGWNQEEMMERTMDIINRTQPTSDPLHTSRFVGQPSQGAKRLIFGVFQSARDNIRGEVQTNVQDLMRAYYLKDTAGMRKAAANINRAVTTSAVLVALIQTGVRRMLDGGDEEDNFLFDWAVQSLNNMVGLVPFAGNIAQGLIDINLKGRANQTNAPLLQKVDELIKESQLPEDSEELPAWAYEQLKNTGALVGSGWANVASQTERAIKED